MTKTVQGWKVHTVVGSITVVDMLTCFALHHSMSNLRAMLMNVQLCLIQGLKFCKFNLGHNVMEVAKNICSIKGAIYHSNEMVARNFIQVARTLTKGKVRKDKTMKFLAMLQTIETNLTRRTQKEFGELGILLSRVVHNVTKIEQNFSFTLVHLLKITQYLM